MSQTWFWQFSTFSTEPLWWDDLSEKDWALPTIWLNCFDPKSVKCARTIPHARISFSTIQPSSVGTSGRHLRIPYAAHVTNVEIYCCMMYIPVLEMIQARRFRLFWHNTYCGGDHDRARSFQSLISSSPKGWKRPVRRPATHGQEQWKLTCTHWTLVCKWPGDEPWTEMNDCLQSWKRQWSREEHNTDDEESWISTSGVLADACTFQDWLQTCLGLQVKFPTESLDLNNFNGPLCIQISTLKLGYGWMFIKGDGTTQKPVKQVLTSDLPSTCRWFPTYWYAGCKQQITYSH